MLREERSPEAETIARSVVEQGACVPQLFSIEIANVLLQAVRRKRITSSCADVQLRQIEALALSCDSETSSNACDSTYLLAASEGLTVYNATYLELALRLGAQLATLDRDLAAAARRHGLTVIP